MKNLLSILAIVTLLCGPVSAPLSAKNLHAVNYSGKVIATDPATRAITVENKHIGVIRFTTAKSTRILRPDGTEAHFKEIRKGALVQIHADHQYLAEEITLQKPDHHWFHG